MQSNTAKKALLAILGIVGIILVSLYIYFSSPRESVVRSSINYVFEQFPQIRWGTRSTLKVLEFPIAITAQLFIRDKLPSYELLIAPDQLALLNQNLPEAKEGVFLGEENRVPVNATFTSEGKTYDAQVRYRGDNYNHWAHDKKSWRVELKDAYVNGMSTFNFIIPEDRMFVQELFSFRLAKRLNLIAPKAYPATLRVNRGSKQYYLLIQHWHKDVAEYNTRPDGGVFLGESAEAELYKSIYSIQTFGKSSQSLVDYSPIKRLFDLLYEDDGTFYKEIPAVIDTDQTIRWIAHANAMFSQSQKYTHNIVLYYNTASGLLEPVPWNVTMFDGHPKDTPIDIDYNPLITKILKNSQWKAKRDKYIQDVIGGENQLKEDINWLSQIQKNSRPAAFGDTDRLFLLIEYELQINSFKNRYQEGYQKLKENLK